jgi:hypothetical protein
MLPQHSWAGSSWPLISGCSSERTAPTTIPDSASAQCPGKPIEASLSLEANPMLCILDGDRGNKSVAGYVVYRARGDVNVKAKPHVSLCNDSDDNDTNLSAGIGMVFRVGRGRRFFLPVLEKKPAQLVLRGFCLATVLADRSNFRQLSA